MMKRDTLPHSAEAERASLGTCLLAGAIPPEAASLTEADLFLDSHRKIWAAMQRLQGRGSGIDLVTLAEELMRNNGLEAVGGAVYLSSLTDSLPRLPNVAHYAKIVKDKALLRRLVYFGQNLMTEAAKGPEDIGRLLAWAEAEIHSDHLKRGSWSETNFSTAKELAERMPETTEWLLEGFLAKGCITEFSGKVKSGKTTLLLAICRSLLDGKAFAGMRVGRAGGVVYLSEQPESSFRESLDVAGLLGEERFHYLPFHLGLRQSWPEVVRSATDKAQRTDSPAIFIDTLPQWARISGDGENSAGEALEAMRPLQEAAGSKNLAVALTRHERKSGGEVGDSGRGSSAFAGVADIVVAVRRAEGDSKTVRVLHALSRFRETPATYALELKDGAYVGLGTEGELALHRAKEAILEAMPMDSTIPEIELFKQAEIPRSTGRRALERLIADGLVIREGSGKKGDGFRYATQKFVSDQLPSYRWSESILRENEPSGNGKAASDWLEI